MSEWEPWSDCDTECGSGMMTRKRLVLKEPVNGGKHCPSMVQKRACMGTRCPNYPGSALKGECAGFLFCLKKNIYVS